jgi:hypothetical protein
MRAFVFLLILANLLFFSWSRGFLGTAENPDSLRIQQQLLADQVKLVVRDAPSDSGVASEKPEKAEKLVKPEEKPQPETCLQISDLPLADIVRIESLVSGKFSAFKAERLMNPGSGQYWVFIPPLPSKQDADRKASELKAMRVPEFFIVQDAGPNRYAISLGIFSSKEAAAERLSELREKGVRSAKVGARDLKPAIGALAMHGPEAQAELLTQALKESFSSHKVVACKAKVAATQ